ncbi:hypothetical protein MAP00_008620 [Monascus purpureus]|nr:hypothetical protein MAP00_008620 [Monascus purpureus]
MIYSRCRPLFLADQIHGFLLLASQPCLHPSSNDVFSFPPPSSRNMAFYTRHSCMGTSSKQDLSSYTSGRLLFKEGLRLQERHVGFNLPALLQEAETMVSPDNNHGHAASVAKFAEGGFNREP